MKATAAIAAGISLVATVLVQIARAATPMGCGVANLLCDGDFDQGLDGWVSSGNKNLTYVVHDGFHGYWMPAVENFVYAGPVGSDGELSESFSDLKGGLLTVTGWLAGNGSKPSVFNMGLDGAAYVKIDPVPLQSFTEYTFTAVATGYDTFFAQFRDDPSFEAFGGFSVSENAVSAPEPASWVTIILGLGALGGAVRRRRALAPA